MLITTVSDFVGGAPYDLVTHCEGNWYILNLRSTTPFLRKYNAEGTLLHSWAIYNPSGISVESGAGFAIIGTTLYTDNTAAGGGITLYSMSKDTVEVLRTISDKVLSVGDDLGCCAGNVPTRPEVMLKVSKTVLCNGSEPVNFSAVPLAGGSVPVYQWLVNGIPAGSGTPDFSYSPANGDKVVCVMTSNSPCASPSVVSSDTVRIAVYEELPWPPLVVSPLTYCKGVTAKPLSATTTVAGSQLNWYTSATGGTHDLAPPVPPTNDTGAFIYYVAEGDGDCISPRVPIKVSVSEVILSDVTMGHPAAYESLDGFIRFKANKAHELYIVNYRINSVPQPELNLSSDASGYITISKLGNGIYDKITVSDALGCSGYIDAVELAFCTRGQVPMPNSFTPNGDHINDVFYVRGSGFTVKRFYIYDRLGNLVFSKENFPPNDPQYGWDGKTNGKVISDAAGFVYMLETVCLGTNTPLLTKGAVLMIK